MPTIYNLAQISNDVYGATTALSMRVHGITRQWGQQSGRTSLQAFFAAPYKCGNALVIAFAGTNDPRDVVADIRLYSIQNSQLTQAIEYTRQQLLRVGFRPENVSLTGHSLGGALAKFASLCLAREGTPVGVTVAFNAPNLRSGMLEQTLTWATRQFGGAPINYALQLFPRSDQPSISDREWAARVLNIRTAIDQVSQIGQPLGRVETLPMPNPELSATNPSVYAGVAGAVVDAHLMGTLIRALDGRPDLRNADAYLYVRR